MRASTQRTLADGCAFIGITGTNRGLHCRTRINLMDFAQLNVKELRHELNEAGQQLAAKSKLWAAHCWLVAQGFTLDVSRKVRMTCLIYKNAAGQVAHTYWKGTVFCDGKLVWRA